MRLLYATHRYLPQISGAEWAAHGYAAALARAGHEVTVVTAVEGPPKQRAERTLDGVRILHGRADPSLSRHVEKVRPDVLLTQLDWAPRVVAFGAEAGLPVVVFCHAPGAAERAPGAALYVLPSQVLAEQAPTAVSKVVVPPPIDRTRVLPPEDAPHDRIVVVNLTRAKGGALFWAIARACPDRQFLAVRGGYGEQIVEELPNVEVWDARPDMAEVYARARIVLLPSRAETFGLVGVEAQMAGVPVVSADLPALRESLGEGAVFVAGGDAEAWAAAIATLDDPAAYGAAVAAAAQANAARYDAAASGEALEAALRGLSVGAHRPEATPATAPVVAPAAPVAGSKPVVCAVGAAGQSAYAAALVAELGFEAVPLAGLEPHLAAGAPVLANGWWPEFAPLVERHPGQLYLVWHSGWSGSDLMGEGDHLAHVLGLLRAGRINLFWLDRRDVPPPGAQHLAPIWSPRAIEQMLPERPEKCAGTVMAGLHGNYPTPPKNATAAIVGAIESGATVHLGRSSLERRGAAVLDRLLAERPHVLHDALPQPDFLRLLAEMEVLVHPSISETWPTAVIQAAYVGTPAVISEVVAWAHRLSERAQALCIVRPATSTGEIACLTRHLLASPDDRAYLLAEQRRVLDELLPEHVEEATATLRAAGFPVRAAGEAHDLTVFVVTVGEPSTDECIRRLRAQDVPFRLEVIDRVAPMDRAFQAMLDRCETPLYIQVDADMLLRPDAIRRMREAIEAEPEDVAFWCGWLWDRDYPQAIQGVKIYRHDICRRFPYQESQSCEMDQFARMQAAGFRHVAPPMPTTEDGCLGEHFASQTPDLAYRRFRRLAEKYRTHDALRWVESHLPRLLGRMAADPSPINRARFLGAMAGLVAPLGGEEADFRAPPPELPLVWDWFGEGALDAYYPPGSAPPPVATPAPAAQVRSVREVDDPRELILYLTDKCTFRCPFCRRQKKGRIEGLDWIPPGEQAPRQDMEPLLVQYILDTFPAIRGACLAGFGEPLCHPQLGDIIDVLAKRDVAIGLITNGSLLLHRREELASWPLAYLSVSLNATTPAAHAVATGAGEGSWRVVLDGIRWVAEHTGHNIGASFVTHRGNVGEVPALLALGQDLGLKFVHLVNLLPHGDPDEPWFLDHVLTEGCPEMAALEANKALPGADLVKAWPEPISLSGEPPRRCESPWTTLGVNSWGHTSLCRRVEDPIDYHGDHFKIPAMWHNDQNARLRRAMAGALPLPARCRRCFGCWRG